MPMRHGSIELRSGRRSGFGLAVATFVLTLFACIAPAGAGGGPENVLLVVNPANEGSQEIANYYTRWRHIPSSNVLELPLRGQVGEIDGKSFREGILKPILETIEQRGLAAQIDYIVYSSDFPYAVDLTAELGAVRPNKLSPPVGSINSMTYLSELALLSDPQLESTLVNRYAISRLQNPPTRGFQHDTQWSPEGDVAVGSGRRYFLSTMLAVTTEAGNTVDEALSYLRRAALADGTRPNGTIYYMTSGDVARAGVPPRTERFDLAVQLLGNLGVKAENIQGVLPDKKDDVQGVMVGAAKFDWAASGSKIRPGAICDHLTSFGGVLKKQTHQTNLSEFLRYGAAGACGTVREPTNLAAKFPNPMMHVHYARGLTLAEAFYHAIPAPFQQLIVGDPLCRPWAIIPTVAVDNVHPGETLRGEVQLKPSAKISDGHKIREFQLFVDGRLVDRKLPGQTFRLDSTRLADGWHELRVVAIESSPIASQGRLILPVTVDNQGRVCSLKSESGRRVSGNQSIRLTASSPGSRGVVIYHNRRRVGQFEGEQGEVQVDPRDLGPGPVRLFAIGLGDGKTQRHVVSPPIELEVDRWKPLVRLAR